MEGRTSDIVSGFLNGLIPLEQLVCSREWSKKLKEAGAPQVSRFYWVPIRKGYGRAHPDYNEILRWEIRMNKDINNFPDAISAYLTDELLRWLPLCYAIWSTPQSGEMKWWCRFNEAHAVVHKERPMFSSDAPANVCAETLYYLIKNKLVKLEG